MELHRGMDGSGDGIDTDARDDAEAAKHITLPLSSAAWRLLASDSNEDEEDDNGDDDEPAFVKRTQTRVSLFLGRVRVVRVNLSASHHNPEEKAVATLPCEAYQTAQDY